MTRTLTRAGWLPLSLVTLVVAGDAAAGDWPNWRGPDGQNRAAEGDYPTSFSPEENVVWSVSMPGPGSSTPIVLGDRVILTCKIDGDDALVVLDRGGQERWRRRFGPGRPAKHRNATGANPSAVTDGQRVFAYYKSGLIVGLTLEGNELWRRNLQDDYGKDTLWWDLGTSPVVTDAGVLIAVMQAGDSYLVTLDAATGETVWKTERTFVRPKESDQAYTTPTLVDTEAGPTVVVWGADHVTGHDPATGEERFRCGGFNPNDDPMWRSIASATIEGDIAVVPFGRGDYVGAVRLGGAGDVTATHRLWTTKGAGADATSPAVGDGKAYVVGDKGQVTCLDIATGEKLWSGRLPRSKAEYFATPLLAGDRLYAFREDGAGFTVGVADGFELLASCELEDTVVASPVPLGDDRLLVRTRETLWCFGEPR